MPSETEWRILCVLINTILLKMWGTGVSEPLDDDTEVSCTLRLKDIGAAVCMSPATTQTRLVRLERAGLIRREVIRRSLPTVIYMRWDTLRAAHHALSVLPAERREVADDLTE